MKKVIISGAAGFIGSNLTNKLISQGYNPLVAAIFGVYLHGRSADIAVENFGYQSLIASHLIQYLG